MKTFKLSLLCTAIAGTLVGCGGDGSSPAPKPTPTPTELDKALLMAHPWMDTLLTPEQRAGLLVPALTLAQKEQQIVGSGIGVIPELPSCLGGRHVTGISTLEIPTLRITNGPVGIGQNDCVSTATDPTNLGAVLTSASSAKATALPSAISLAASFDPAVAAEFGNVVGVEANHLALHVFEAPGANLARLPVLGRNFEYFGEDPFLTGTMAVAETKAVQSNGVIAMAKHFVANEQETNRTTVSEIIDDQVLHELYLLPFEMAVKDAKVAAVMCSYNIINGYHACSNTDMLTGVLRDQWGFTGYVQSDFGAATDTVSTLLAGMDHEMFQATVWTTAKLNAALAAGQIQESNFDTALLRRYTQMFRMGIFDRPLVQTAIDFTAGGAHAQSIGNQATVLLQNNGALPLASTAQNVVVIGKQTQVYAQQAVAGGARVGFAFGSGGGSSDVVPNYTVTPVQGIQNVLSKLGNTTAQVHLILVDDANASATMDGTPTTYAAALAAAAGADQVVIMAGTISEEGADRASFTTTAAGTLSAVGDNLDWYTPKSSATTTASGGSNNVGNSNTVAMIQGVMGATSTTAKSMLAKTALVLKDTAGVTMDPSLVGATGPAILEAWFPGQEDGNIVANALYGVTNPSGKLPVTFPLVGHSFMGQVTPNQYPGVINSAGVPVVSYDEKLNIGYRWYNANSVTPAFPFGFGLSYTTFGIASTFTPASSSDTRYHVTSTVSNSGAKAGSEVVQVYISVPSDAYLPQPPKRLVGYRKVAVAAGAASSVTIDIDPAATNHPLGVWNKTKQQFVIPSGTYTVYAGNSSANLTNVGTFTR